MGNGGPGGGPGGAFGGGEEGGQGQSGSGSVASGLSGGNAVGNAGDIGDASIGAAANANAAAAAAADGDVADAGIGQAANSNAAMAQGQADAQTNSQAGSITGDADTALAAAAAEQGQADAQANSLAGSIGGNRGSGLVANSDITNSQVAKGVIAVVSAIPVIGPIMGALLAGMDYAGAFNGEPGNMADADAGMGPGPGAEPTNANRQGFAAPVAAQAQQLKPNNDPTQRPNDNIRKENPKGRRTTMLTGEGGLPYAPRTRRTTLIGR